MFPRTGTQPDINQKVSCHVETVVKLSLKKDTPKIEVTMEPDEESNYTPQEKATYSKIKEYVKDKYGVNVHTSYIAQVKRMCGLDMGENYNKSKKENPEVKQCPQEKVEYIKDALRHFKLIQDVNQDMNYKDYIKDEYCDIYVRERDNLADRIIEAKYT